MFMFGRAVAAKLLAVMVIISPASAEEAREHPGLGIKNVEARELFEIAYHLHLGGDLESATLFYKRSLEVAPSPEAFTHLGWLYAHQERYGAAMEECSKAIDLDPGYGNPYNDIGVYLRMQHRDDEAVPWFFKALVAKRYCCRHFPHYNLAMVYLNQGKLYEAAWELDESLQRNPDFLPARTVAELVKRLLTEHQGAPDTNPWVER